MTNPIFEPLLLPNNTSLPNRLAKAAMEENMAVSGHLPGEGIFNLYKAWARGGVGLLITGNVMVDHRAMTGPGGIALEKGTPLEPFREWVLAATQNGNGLGNSDTNNADQNNPKIWMQINHPGRQVYAAMGGQVLSPSDIALDMGKHSKLFGKPRPMTEGEIQELIERFAITAERAIEAGFDGVQIHAAHGYLISQFLSPLTNRRNDSWGGPIENRARLLYEIVKAVKARLPEQAVVSVKLNSADFQRGGFDADDALTVVKHLGELHVDLVELSGGSYESPAMQGNTADGRTLEREAYFLKFAEKIAKEASMPVMTTGGITRLPVAESVIQAGVDMVGMGRALAFSPDLPKRWRADGAASAHLPVIKWKDKTLSALAVMAVTKQQFQRMGKGQKPKPNVSPVLSLLSDQIRLRKLTKVYRKRYHYR